MDVGIERQMEQTASGWLQINGDWYYFESGMTSAKTGNITGKSKWKDVCI